MSSNFDKTEPIHAYPHADLDELERREGMRVEGISEAVLILLRSEVDALVAELRESRQVLVEVRERTKDRPAYSRCPSAGHWCLTDFTYDQMEGSRMRMNKIAFDLTFVDNEVNATFPLPPEGGHSPK